jgi:hypothetical protein
MMGRHSAPCRTKTGRSSHVVGGKADDREAESSLGSFDRMVDQSTTWQQRGEFSTGTGAEKDGADNQTATRCSPERSLRYRPP